MIAYGWVGIEPAASTLRLVHGGISEVYQLVGRGRPVVDGESDRGSELDFLFEDVHRCADDFDERFSE